MASAELARLALVSPSSGWSLHGWERLVINVITSLFLSNLLLLKSEHSLWFLFLQSWSPTVSPASASSALAFDAGKIGQLANPGSSQLTLIGAMKLLGSHHDSVFILLLLFFVFFLCLQCSCTVTVLSPSTSAPTPPPPLLLAN